MVPEADIFHVTNNYNFSVALLILFCFGLFRNRIFTTSVLVFLRKIRIVIFNNM